MIIEVQMETESDLFKIIGFKRKARKQLSELENNYFQYYCNLCQLEVVSSVLAIPYSVIAYQ